MSETKTKNLCTVPAADLTDNQYFIAEDGGELKRIPKAQVVLKKLENMLATDTENLAGGGEVTAQELLDVLAEQVANKLLAKSQVVNNLLATVEGNPLDATQGKALKDLIDTTNNNLSKYNFNLGNTTANNHKNIDRIATFSGGTWVSKDYNADFGGQWCLVDSFLINDNGAMQRIISTQTNTVLATRYCEKNVWGDWDIGVTKSDLTALTDIILTPANSYSFSADFTYGYKRAGWVEIQFSLASAFDLNKNLILSMPNGCLPKKQVWFPVYESSGGNVIARGYIVGSNIYINGSNSINGKTKLFGHVVYMSES